MSIFTSHKAIAELVRESQTQEFSGLHPLRRKLMKKGFWGQNNPGMEFWLLFGQMVIFRDNSHWLTSHFWVYWFPDHVKLSLLMPPPPFLKSLAQTFAALHVRYPLHEHKIDSILLSTVHELNSRTGIRTQGRWVRTTNATSVL